MVFFRMLHSDFSRMIKSWKFYLAIAFIAVLTFLSIYPEAAGSGGNCSVYYLVNARGGVSAFLGYSLCFGLMALRLPFVTADELETLAGLTTLTGYESLLLHAPIFYFIAVFATEAFGYAFLAVCALTHLRG